MSACDRHAEACFSLGTALSVWIGAYADDCPQLAGDVTDLINLTKDELNQEEHHDLGSS